MFRHRNSDANGRPFSLEIVQAVWDSATATAAHSPLKEDPFGSLIWREAYGNTNSKLGWEIHHLVPVDQGGDDDLENLQAVQWENHRHLDAKLAAAAAELGEAEPEDPLLTPQPAPAPVSV